MKIITYKAAQKDKSIKYIIKISDDGYNAEFANNGDNLLKYEDFNTGKTKQGSIFWMSHIDNDNELYNIRHWGKETKEEQKQQMIEFIKRCLSLDIKFSDNGNYLEYDI